MKMLGAIRRFGWFFGYFSFSEGIFKKEPDQRIQFRKTNKVGKFEVKKVKKKGSCEQKCRSCRDLSTLPLKVQCHATWCFILIFSLSKMAARILEAAAPANEFHA